MSAKKQEAWEVVMADRNGGKSRFAILGDMHDDIVSDLEILKQKIRNIASGPSGNGHEKTQIKLEKGRMNLNGSTQQHKREQIGSGKGKGKITQMEVDRGVTRGFRKPT